MSIYGENEQSRIYNDLENAIQNGDIDFLDLLEIVKDLYDNLEDIIH